MTGVQTCALPILRLAEGALQRIGVFRREPGAARAAGKIGDDDMVIAEVWPTESRPSGPARLVESRNRQTAHTFEARPAVNRSDFKKTMRGRAGPDPAASTSRMTAWQSPLVPASSFPRGPRKRQLWPSRR